MVSKDYNKEHYQEFWESVSYFKTTSPGNRWMFELIDEIVRSIKPEIIQSILDVGCGEGSKTMLLSKKFFNAHVTGIDFTQSGIESANSRLDKYTNCSFLCVDANNSRIWQEQYDMIFCSEVLEHVTDWKELVDKFTDNAKKYILLTFPVGRMRKYEIAEGHIRNFKRGEMEDYLSQHNFKPVEIYYAGFPFYSPIGRELANIKWLFKFYDNKIRRVNKPTLITKLYFNVFHFLFRHCSTKHRNGDQFVGLFKRN